MQLKSIEKITGKIIIKSGLRIGGSGNGMRIGGVDAPIIRNPSNDKPYIPGSSLKGKIRCLLEQLSGLSKDGNPLSLSQVSHDKFATAIVKIFGQSSGDKEVGQPTRVSFFDCDFNPEWLAQTEKDHKSITEEKTEVAINRLSGIAQSSGPRQMERVVAGAEFDFTVTLKIYDNDDKQYLLNRLFQGMKLLELDSLGSSGSRGYGKIKFALSNPEHQQILDQFEENLNTVFVV
ncbi:MAG: hypothetical protein RLZZ293_190 [Pseudomonadota bacterium]|jgi:CRISPR-associated protein Csm3